MPQQKNYIAQFKGFDDFVEIVKLGDHVAMNGTKVTFTAADLDAMAANTPTNSAPIVIGHPKTDAPAYGWGVEYKRDGDALFAKFDQVNPTFAKWVEDGAYKKRSVSVIKGDAGWRIKHVGFLGAAAPAIEGMTDMSFASDDGAVAFEFGVVDAIDEIGYLFNSVGGFMRSMRDSVIAASGIEVADKYFPEYQLSSIQSASETLRGRLSQSESPSMALFAEAVSNTIIADLAANAAQDAQVQAQYAEHNAELAAKDDALKLQIAQNQALQAQLARQAHEQQVAVWQAAGKLTPASAAGVADFMAHLSDSNSFEFAVADASVTGAAWFAAFIEGQKPINLGTEQAGGAAIEPVDASAEAIAAAAQEFTASQSAKGIAVEWQDAVMHIVNTTNHKQSKDKS